MKGLMVKLTVARATVSWLAVTPASRSSKPDIDSDELVPASDVDVSGSDQTVDEFIVDRR